MFPACEHQPQADYIPNVPPNLPQIIPHQQPILTFQSQLKFSHCVPLHYICITFLQTNLECTWTVNLAHTLACTHLIGTNHILDVYGHCSLNVPTDGRLGTFYMFLRVSPLATLDSQIDHITNVFTGTISAPPHAHLGCTLNVPAMVPAVYLGGYIST